MVLTKHKTKDGQLLGVLKTPCYPCSYYAGPIVLIQGQYYSGDNATSNFHRTKADASKALLELIKLLENK
jgi:hypothetical protein